MSSRFQPTGTPATFDPLWFGTNPSAADFAFQITQETAYNACMQLIANVSLGDQRKNEAAQIQLLAIRVPLTRTTLVAAGATATSYAGTMISRALTDSDLSFITDWSATLSQMQATLKQLQS